MDVNEEILQRTDIECSSFKPPHRLQACTKNLLQAGQYSPCKGTYFRYSHTTTLYNMSIYVWNILHDTNAVFFTFTWKDSLMFLLDTEIGIPTYTYVGDIGLSSCNKYSKERCNLGGATPTLTKWASMYDVSFIDTSFFVCIWSSLSLWDSMLLWFLPKKHSSSSHEKTS